MKKLSLFLSCFLLIIGLLNGQTTTDKIIDTDTNGRNIYESPKGERYYINANGNKTYIKSEKPINSNTAVEGDTKASKTLTQYDFLDDYDKLWYKLHTEKVLKSKNLDSLGVGSVVGYRTNEGRYGKFEVQDNDKNLTIKWTTYKKNSDTNYYIQRGYKRIQQKYSFGTNLIIEGSMLCDLDSGKQSTNSADFWWVQPEVGAPYIKPKSGTSLYVISKKNKINLSQPTNITEQLEEQLSSTVIGWQNPLLNNSTTYVPTFDLKACIETSETIKEYIFIQNGQRKIIARGLIPQKATDCTNNFSQSVTLKEGENTFQLEAQTGKNSIKSEIFILFYDKNVNIATPSVSEAKIEKRLALVVGNAEYLEGSKLKNPVNDANLMSNTLKSLGFQVMQVTNANKTQLERAIRDFSIALPDFNVALFYYAGHGIQVDGENYLIPTDAKLQDKKDVRFEAVKVRFAIEEFERHPDNVNIVILDACRNNPFRSWARGGAEGFKQMDIGGTLIAFATAPDATASDGTGNNGLYTEELVRQMQLNQPIEAVFRETRKAVLNRSNRTQNPQEWSQLTQQFFFKK
jgi:hypothetical protein